MDCSTPGLSVHHQFPGFTKTHAHCGEGNGNPLQYSCLGNPMDRGAWLATVHGVVKSWTQLSGFTFTFHFHELKKEMATHSSILVWKIPGTEEPGGLPPMGSQSRKRRMRLSSSSSMSIESVMPSNDLILCRPLLLPPSIFPSIRVFPNESAFCIRWPKYWSFRFNIRPSSENPRLISFRMDWLDLLAVQGTLKTLLQHHSSKHHFFGAQLSLQSSSHIHT